MAKRDEFDPNEILDDVTAASEDDFDILGDLPDLSTEKTVILDAESELAKILMGAG